MSRRKAPVAPSANGDGKPGAWDREDDSEPIPCASASEFRAQSVSWLWQGVISIGALAFLDGEPGAGKTAIAFDLAARVTRGRTMPDGTKGARGNVLLLLGEDDASTLALPRLHAAGADLKRVFFFGKHPKKGALEVPRFPAAAAGLASAVLQHHARLVIIDPYMSFLASGLNPYVEQDVRQGLEPIAAVAREQKTAVLAIRHPTKNTNQRRLYRGGGSLGICAIARTVLWAGESGAEDGRKVFAVVKSNLAKAKPALAYSIEDRGECCAVKWHGTAEADGEDELTTAEGKERRTTLEEAKRLLTLALAKGAQPCKALLCEADESGIGRRTLTVAKAALGVKSRRRTGSDGKSFWEWKLSGKNS